MPAPVVDGEILEETTASDDAAPEGGGGGVGRPLPHFPHAGKAVEEPAGGTLADAVTAIPPQDEELGHVEDRCIVGHATAVFISAMPANLPSTRIRKAPFSQGEAGMMRSGVTPSRTHQALRVDRPAGERAPTNGVPLSVRITRGKPYSTNADRSGATAMLLRFHIRSNRMSTRRIDMERLQELVRRRGTAAERRPRFAHVQLAADKRGPGGADVRRQRRVPLSGASLLVRAACSRLHSPQRSGLRLTRRILRHGAAQGSCRSRSGSSRIARELRRRSCP